MWAPILLCIVLANSDSSKHNFTSGEILSSSNVTTESYRRVDEPSTYCRYAQLVPPANSIYQKIENAWYVFPQEASSHGRNNRNSFKGQGMETWGEINWAQCRESMATETVHWLPFYSPATGGKTSSVSTTDLSIYVTRTTNLTSTNNGCHLSRYDFSMMTPSILS